MSVEVTRLPSGLTVVTDVMTHLETASLGVWVGAGSRDERPDDRSPDPCGHRMPVEEERLQPRRGDPGGERARDQQAEDDVSVDRGPVHDEVARHRRPPLRERSRRRKLPSR